MDERDRQLVNQFKCEYKARLFYDERLKDLAKMKRALSDQLGIHSVQFTSNKGTPESRDHKLAAYSTKTEKIDKEIGYIQQSIRRVDSILMCIPAEIRKHMYNVYSGKYNYLGAAVREGVSERQMKYNIDKAILSALKESGIA